MSLMKSKGMGEKEIIANRVAAELKDGDIVNLGIGIPTLVANYIPKNIKVIIQSENGIMGMGSLSQGAEIDPDIINAGGLPVSVNSGAMFFDSSVSFGIIRGGHVDLTVLGALEVDEKGNLANWIVPGKMVSGMGGAMDLVAGAKRVIIAMLHCQNGKPKILKQCSLPCTALGKVNMIITEMGVMEITEKGIVLKELLPPYSIEDIQNATEAELIIDPGLSLP